MELAHSPQEISPNYTNIRSEICERSMDKLVGDISNGVMVKLDRDVVINLVREFVPERLAVVSSKLEHEGKALADLDTDTLVDRLLGIDNLFRLGGKTYAIDVTSGNGTLLHNKKVKTENMRAVFTSLGIDHFIVVSLSEPYSANLVQRFLSDIKNTPDESFTRVLKYRTTQSSAPHS